MFYFYLKRDSAIDVITNTTAATVVHLLNKASIVLPLFLPKKVSAPPAIEPDNPALFPDCKRTIAINETATMIWTMVKNIVIFTPPESLTYLF